MHTRKLKLGEKDILVVDGLVSEERVAEVDAFCRTLPFHRIRYGYRAAADAPMN